MEVPAAFRDMAERSLMACRESFEQLKVSTDRANASIGKNLQYTSKSVADCNLRMVEAFYASVASTFDLYQSLLQARGPVEVAEVSSAHMRKQYEAVTALAKDMTVLAQSVAAESAKASRGSS